MKGIGLAKDKAAFRNTLKDQPMANRMDRGKEAVNSEIALSYDRGKREAPERPL